MSAGWGNISWMGSKAKFFRNRSSSRRGHYFIVGFMDGIEAHLHLFSFAFSDRLLTAFEPLDIGAPGQAWADALKFIHYGFEGIASDVDESRKQQRSADELSF